MRWPKHKVIFCVQPYKISKGKEVGSWKTLYGQADLEKNVIRINLLKKIHPAQTYLHELFHLKYKEKSEKDILHLERSTWHSMSAPKRLKLYRKLFSLKKRKKL